MTGLDWAGSGAAALALVLAVGCGGEERSQPTGARPEESPQTGTESEAGPVAEDPTFELRASASGSYTAGEAGTFEIRLVPRGDYHVNIDPGFPFSIALAGPEGIQFAKTNLDRHDAAEFTEQRARFAVGFTPQGAGQHRVSATVDFAVCTPSTCLPDTRTLALVLPVQ